MNQKELREARQMAQDRAHALWERTSDASPEIRPFIALEKGIRAYGRVAAYAYRRCESREAQTVIKATSSFYSYALEDIAFVQSADLALRIWVCRVHIPIRMSNFFEHAYKVYTARLHPALYGFSSLDRRILSHMREEARMLMALSDICKHMFVALAQKHEHQIVSCHPHTMMSFLAKHFFGMSRISIGLDLSDASSPLICFHSKYTLNLVKDLIGFFVWDDDEDWPPRSYQVYLSLHPETDYARIDITCSLEMTPALWDALSSYIVTYSKAALYLPELGARLEPLTSDYGYGQGVSLYLPWVTA